MVTRLAVNNKAGKSSMGICRFHRNNLGSWQSRQITKEIQHEHKRALKQF